MPLRKGFFNISLQASSTDNRFCGGQRTGIVLTFMAFTLQSAKPTKLINDVDVIFHFESGNVCYHV